MAEDEIRNVHKYQKCEGLGLLSNRLWKVTHKLLTIESKSPSSTITKKLSQGNNQKSAGIAVER